MTVAERNNKLKHFITCLKCEVSGKPCDDNCSIQYDAGNMGEIIENLEAISKALEQERSRSAEITQYRHDCEKLMEENERLKKALEQEPCEDCISRQAVIDGINEYFHDEYYQRTSIQDCRDCLIEDVIKDLPPVKPQEPKTGHWECNELFYDGESGGAIIRCSKCGNEFKVSPKVFENLYGNERFCNYCGAKMESEG